MSRSILVVILLAAFSASAARAAAAEAVIPAIPGGVPGTAPTSGTPEVPFADYQRGNYATALKEAMSRLSVNPKDAAAMTLIGQIYLDGFAVNPDHAEADRWFDLASKQGDPQADFLLGRAYLVGDGVPKDVATAKTLFERAASKNVAGALYNLGVLAIQSNRDFVAAANDFQRAAAAGDAESDYALSALYQSGQGVPLDTGKAASLLKTAADERNVDAEVAYGIALFNGEGVPKNESLAARYLLRAAASNNAIAQNRIARMLAAGRGVPKNLVEAMKWHILARSAGVKDAWLDQQLATLSPQERSALHDALRQYAGD